MKQKNRAIGIKQSWRLLVAAILTIGGTIMMPASVGASSAGTCTQIEREVSLAEGLPAQHTISGTLCTPRTWEPGPHKVDILLHGGSYNRAYWDWPQQSSTYSYVERTLQAGRATFAYDTLGSGQSDRPLSALVTVQAQAYILHQLIDTMRSDHHFSEITVIGHSMGSMIALHNAAMYGNTTRLVVTGLLHAAGPLSLTATANFYPAMLDPKFFGTIFDPGYLTTRPGTRGDMFYSASADPNVVQYDEQHKDTFSSVFLATSLVDTLTPAPLNIANRIHAEVLLITGEQDALSCGLQVNCADQAAVHNFEAPYYTGAASLTTKIVPNTGHNLTLHPSANESFNEINDWIRTH